MVNRCISMLCALLLCTEALAPAQTPAPGPTPKAATGAIEDRVLPELKFESVPLAEALQFLRDAVPGFNGTIVRAPGVDPNYPTLPKIALKNVTLGQFMDLVRASFPGLDIALIDGKRDVLAGVLRQRHGLGACEAEDRIRAFEKDMRRPGAVK